MPKIKAMKAIITSENLDIILLHEKKENQKEMETMTQKIKNKLPRNIISSEWSFRRYLYIMENRELGFDSAKKRVALDKNRIVKQGNQGELLHYKYLFPKPLRGQGSLLAHPKKSSYVGAKHRHNSRRRSQFGIEHGGKIWGKIQC